MSILAGMNADRQERGGEVLPNVVSHTAAAVGAAVITCVRWKRPFLEDACVWDKADLDGRQA